MHLKSDVLLIELNLRVRLHIVRKDDFVDIILYKCKISGILILVCKYTHLVNGINQFFDTYLDIMIFYVTKAGFNHFKKF